jgi:large subunit ribosomal protein L9
MDVILLERVAKLGQMGDTVRVRDGYARNFLLARGKALRATEGNKKHFETQRAQIEARNLEAKKEAAAVAEKLDGQSFTIIRQAGESGQLYGSVSAPVHLHPEVDVSVTINVARSEEEADRQARGESVTLKEETSMDDLGLEVGAALAEAGDVEL